MTFRNWRWMALFVLVASALSKPVLAQDAPAEDELRAVVKELYREGLQALRDGNFTRCRVRAETAFSQQAHPLTAGLLGFCESHLGAHRDAAEHLWLFLSQGGRPSDSDDFRERVKQRYAISKAEVSALRLQVVPTTATVTVNDKPVDLGAEIIFVEPGKYTLEATAPQHTPETRPLTLAAGEEVALNLSLTPTASGSVGADSSGVSPVVLGVGYGASAALGITSIVLGIVSATENANANSLQDELEAEFGPAPCRPARDARCTERFETSENADRLGNAAIWTGVGAGALLIATLTYHLVADGGSDDQASAEPGTKRNGAEFVVRPYADLGLSLGVGW
ncbi:MAG: hypothetical protein AAF580_17100 [Pseudomonadota bacterium]